MCLVVSCLARNVFAAKRQIAAAVTIQKYSRRWQTRRAYMQLCSAVIFMQASIRTFSVRCVFQQRKEERAALLIQAQWRMLKARAMFWKYQRCILAIQCSWRVKLAKRELRRLRREANETGALREAKNKLEKQLEELSWRLHLEKRLRASGEEAKSLEISKLEQVNELLNAELEAAKAVANSERNRIGSLIGQLEQSVKEKEALESKLVVIEELNKENLLLKHQILELRSPVGVLSTAQRTDVVHRSSVESLTKDNLSMEQELLKARKDCSETIDKLQEVEKKSAQLQQNLLRSSSILEEKLSNLDEENHVLRQKALSLSPRSNLGPVRTFAEKYSGVPTLANTDRRLLFETPSPTKAMTTCMLGQSDSRRSKMTGERHQDNHEFLSRCIKDDLGFENGNPVAACIIYKCLVHWRTFEAERTTIFDYIIEGINDALKVGDENKILPYWLSNASTLLCLLQRNLRSNGFLTTPSRRSGVSGLTVRMAQDGGLMLEKLGCC
ncbi:hypothetical protein ACLOJK_025391 [Asimina triloba]